MARKIKVKSHKRSGSKVESHTRTLNSKKASSGSSNKSPISLNWKKLEKDQYELVGKEFIFYASIDPQDRDWVLDTFEKEAIDSGYISSGNYDTFKELEAEVRDIMKGGNK